MISISSPCCSAFFRGDPPSAIPSRGGLFICPPPARRAAAAALSVSAASKFASAETDPVKRPARGITKPKPISPALQELLGVKEIPRTQALKQIWAYMKEKSLQDPESKKVIVCDEKLKIIFGGKELVGFLEISGLLNSQNEIGRMFCKVGLLVNQIGTITESIRAALDSKAAGWGAMVSHRSGETEYNFIADLSVCLATGQAYLLVWPLDR